MTRTLVRNGPLVGMLGSAIFLLASVVAAFTYRGTLGESYSPLNHWVSELGEIGVSGLATIFNVGLILGGLALAVFMSALGIVALSFFVLGWIAVALATIDIWRRKDARFAKWVSYLGALTVAIFMVFLAVYIPDLLSTATDQPRPATSLVTTLEWLVLIGIIGWVLAASFSWWRYDRDDR
jgi:hypothetical membrane protein